MRRNFPFGEIAGEATRRLVLATRARYPRKIMRSRDYFHLTPSVLAVVTLLGIGSLQGSAFAEPPLNPAYWSPGEGGVSVALESGEAVLTVTDHFVPGRALDLAVVRMYRSGTLGYGPLGAAGWHSPLFAHLQAYRTTGEAIFHDGTGRAWRFLPHDRRDMPCPAGYDGTDFDPYCVESGLHLRLRVLGGARGWQLFDRNNNTITFDTNGHITEVSDRHRQNAQVGTQGSTLRYYHDGYDNLARIEDDLGRATTFEYYRDSRPETEGGDGIRYGLLKRIKDFAGRTIEYEFDEQRRLVRVKLPEVTNPVGDYAAYSNTGVNRPTITYRYDPAVNVTADPANTTAILHGPFAPLRLEGYTLPGSSVLRVRFEYDAMTGRVKTVAFPTPDGQNATGSGIVWGIGYPNEPANAAPATKATVTAPWGQVTEYVLSAGRIADVKGLQVPALAPGDPSPASADAIPKKTVTTHFAYETDGRIKSVTHPDGGATSYAYETGDNMQRANVASVTRTSPGGPTTTAFSYNRDHVAEKQVDPEGRTITFPVAYNAEPRAALQPVTTGYVAEGVLTTTRYDRFGRVLTTDTAGAAPEHTEVVYGKAITVSTRPAFPRRSPPAA